MHVRTIHPVITNEADGAGGQELGPHDRKKIETWYAIRDAGVRLFSERGFDAVSIDDIVASAGVARTTFFNYFSSKEALIRDCEPGERETWQHLLDRPEDEPLWDSLVALLIGFAEFRAEKLIASKLLMMRSPELQALSFDPKHATCADIEAFVRLRTREGHELEAELFLNVALAAGETATGAGRPPSRSGSSCRTPCCACSALGLDWLRNLSHAHRDF
jgi:AcrR family transcriptional regulator